MRRSDRLGFAARMGLAGLSSLAALAGCESECDSSACLALVRAAENTGPGIAGVVAARSDVVVNGCRECEFDQATLQVWATEDPIASEESVAMHMREQRPLATIVAVQHYDQPLEPGRYLVCADRACVNIVVAEGRTTTVNVKRQAEGATTFFVREADAARFVERNGLRHE